MAEGDTHIWLPGSTPLSATCGYTQEVDEETGEVVHPSPTGEGCPDCDALFKQEHPEANPPNPDPETQE